LHREWNGSAALKKQANSGYRQAKPRLAPSKNLQTQSQSHTFDKSVNVERNITQGALSFIPIVWSMFLWNELASCASNRVTNRFP
jgi:hypothetical protein